MKNLFLKPMLLVALFAIVSCENQELNAPEDFTSEKPIFRTVDDIANLDLDQKFDLPADVYTRFLESAVFYDNELRGFRVNELETLFDDMESLKFWYNFDIKIREHVATPRDWQVQPVRVRHWDAYPVEGGCLVKEGYVCLGSPTDILNKKPIPNGCAPSPGDVCYG